MNESIAIGRGESFRQELHNLWMADLLLYIHALFIAFVVFGLLSVLIGKLASWRWVLDPWFRYSHLAAIAYVVIQAWLGLPCPLTVWENAYRAEAGDVVYAGDFIAHWVSELIYYRAAPWVFTVAYSLFGGLTLLTLFWAKPDSLQNRKT